MPHLIQNELLQIGVDPDVGASVTEFSFLRDGEWVALMRPAPEPLERSSFANFIMAPYSNRILDARFSFRPLVFRPADPFQEVPPGLLPDLDWILSEVSNSRVLAVSGVWFFNSRKS